MNILKGKFAAAQAALWKAQDASPFSDTHPDGPPPEPDGNNSEAKRKVKPDE